MSADEDPVLFVGATSKVGRSAVPLLLRQGRRVRAMTRDPARAGDLLRLGAEVVQGDLRDPASLRRACAGAGQLVAAAHALTGARGNDPESVDRRGNRDLFDAARAAGVRHVVFVSARGDGASSPLDFFRIKRETERHLEESGLGHTILLAGPFMETWAEILGGAIARGARAVVFGRGDVPLDFVSAGDVAAEVVAALGERTPGNRRLDLSGPERLTMMQVVALLERACGRRARTIRLPVPLLRVLAACARPLDARAHRLLLAGILLATPGSGSSGASEPPRVAPTRFEEVARRRFARSAAA